MMDLAQKHSSSMSYPLPVVGVVIAGFVYILARTLLYLIHKEKQSLAPASSLDQAEKGSLEKQEEMSEDEIFQLEKRAFFSRVGRLISFSEDILTGTDGRQDVAVCLPPQQICKAWRLPCL
jgi:hypothetical protein